MEKGCKEEGAKLGVNVIYTGPDTADAAKQVQVLQDLVSRGVDGFAEAPMDGDSVIGVIESAIKKGIKVITFDADSPKSQRVCFVQDAGKPANVIEKIVESGLKTFYKEVCLLDQAYVHDPAKTVAQAVKEAEKTVGAPIAVTGFVRYALGEGIEKPAEEA